MTYRQLAERIDNMTWWQQECSVTIEDGCENECYPAELRICGAGHDSLEEDHPVIYTE